MNIGKIEVLKRTLVDHLIQKIFDIFVDSRAFDCLCIKLTLAWKCNGFVRITVQGTG